MDIVGVSFDDPEENDSWAIEHEMQFELWSDLDRELALHFQAADSPTQLLADRKTVILDGQGRLCLFYPDINVNAHPAEVLDDVELLFARGQ